MIQKIVFTLAAVFGIVLVFFVSWFWRLLLVPMIVILAFDVLSGIFRRKD